MNKKQAKRKTTDKKISVQLYAPDRDPKAISDSLKVRILTEQIVKNITDAPDNIRHHLAAVSWWIIVGIAEQTEAGARVKLRNNIERVYTDGTRTDRKAFLFAEKAIDHFVLASRDAYRITLAAAPLRAFFHLDKWDGYELSECFEFVNRIKNRRVRDFLRDALKENEAECDDKDSESILAHALKTAPERKRKADEIAAKNRGKRSGRRAKEAC